MFRTKSRGSEENQINHGAMADIAFLMLIFFLVTTIIVEDKGILVRLPPWTEENTPVEMHPSNVFRIQINAENQLLLRGEQASVKDLKEKLKIFILNPENSHEFPDSPKRAVVSLQNDRGTMYDTYIEVYNEIISVYNELRDDLAFALFKMPYGDIEPVSRQHIREEIPMIISEAEPTSFGGSN